MAIYQLRTNRSLLGELSVTLILQLYYQHYFHGLLALLFAFHYIELGSIIKGLNDYFNLITQTFFFFFISKQPQF